MSIATDLADVLELTYFEGGDIELYAADELRRLDRVNAELVAQNEAQKNEWISWDAKRRELERDAARYRAIREGGSLLKLYSYDDANDPYSGDWLYKPRPEFVDEWCDAARAALTSATKEQQ